MILIVNRPRERSWARIPSHAISHAVHVTHKTIRLSTRLSLPFFLRYKKTFKHPAEMQKAFLAASANGIFTLYAADAHFHFLNWRYTQLESVDKYNVLVCMPVSSQ